MAITPPFFPLFFKTMKGYISINYEQLSGKMVLKFNKQLIKFNYILMIMAIK